MSRAKLGEKGSMSIETLYAYCSGTEEDGSSGVLKSVLDPMYPFFVFPVLIPFHTSNDKCLTAQCQEICSADGISPGSPSGGAAGRSFGDVSPEVRMVPEGKKKLLWIRPTAEE